MLNKITMILAIGSIVLCITSMVLAHKEWVSANAGGGLFVLSGLVGLLAFISALLVLVFTHNYPIALLGCVGLMPLLAVVSGVTGAFQHPRINDISTDTADPPAFVAALTVPRNVSRDMAFPAENVDQIKQGYPDIAPLKLNLPPDQAYARALEVAGQTAHWEITRKDEAKLEFEGIATTKLFHWKDDFIVRVRPAEGGGSRVDMRSKSREGKSDLGANARRITAFFGDLQKYDIGKSN